MSQATIQLISWLTAVYVLVSCHVVHVKDPMALVREAALAAALAAGAYVLGRVFFRNGKPCAVIALFMVVELLVGLFLAVGWMLSFWGAQLYLIVLMTAADFFARDERSTSGPGGPSETDGSSGPGKTGPPPVVAP